MGDEWIVVSEIRGSKVSVIVVETPFKAWNVPESKSRQMSEAFAEHAEGTVTFLTWRTLRGISC